MAGRPKVERLDRLLSPRELAEYLGVPVQTVYWWNNQGIGPPRFTLNNKLVRYRERDVQAWLSEQQAS